MDPEEVKKEFVANKGRSQTLFQRKKQVKEIGMEDFSLIKMLGRGAFGKVMLCEKKDTKEIFAVKSLRKEDIIAKDHIDYIKTERKILEQTHHPFLINLEYAFQTEQNIFFVMKFMK
jgi:serum/glucocorticoid-regulated kinase 2